MIMRLFSSDRAALSTDALANLMSAPQAYGPNLTVTLLKLNKHLLNGLNYLSMKWRFLNG